MAACRRSPLALPLIVACAAAVAGQLRDLRDISRVNGDCNDETKVSLGFSFFRFGNPVHGFSRWFEVFIRVIKLHATWVNGPDHRCF